MIEPLIGWLCQIGRKLRIRHVSPLVHLSHGLVLVDASYGVYLRKLGKPARMTRQAI